MGSFSDALHHRQATLVIDEEATTPRTTTIRSGILRPSSGQSLITALTAMAFLIHGYHPYGEDGGVYLAGVLKLLHPSLYPHWTGFVTAHLRFSLFARLVAALVHITHADVMIVLLVLYIACIWLTLFAGWQIAVRLYSSVTARAGAVALLALVLTMPVAGTSLMIMDPYMTGRSIATPLALLALAFAIDLCRQTAAFGRASTKTISLFTLSLLGAAAAHPLMAGYASLLILLYMCFRLTSGGVRLLSMAALCILPFAAAAILDSLTPAQSSAYAQVAFTRYYWFLSTWHWYELLGLAAPPLVLLLLARGRHTAGDVTSHALASVSCITALLSVLISTSFAVVSSSTFLVARLQPLRAYVIIYILMILALGACAGEYLLQRSLLRWATFLILLGGSMYFVQIQTYPHSAHLELPWSAPKNPWTQAFVWIRQHSAPDAIVALDADYTNADEEDSQNFRAIAQRSNLPDVSKDGGVASIAPELTGSWFTGITTQKNLNQNVGPEQLARLQAHSVDWIIVPDRTPVSTSCEWSNHVVKICSLAPNRTALLTSTRNK